MEGRAARRICASKAGIAEECIQPFREEAGAARYEVAGLPLFDDGHQASGARCDDGCATGERFDCDEAKAFVI